MSAAAIADAGVVLLSQAAMTLLPWLPAACCLTTCRRWPQTLLLAGVLGSAAAAVLGTVRLVPQTRFVPAYLLLTAAVTVALTLRRRVRARTGGGDLSTGTGDRTEDILLLVILLLGLTVRSVGPLAEPALAHSDGYGHLQFLKDIVTHGALRNPVYPPGYHWVLALPVLTFDIEPYALIRFGGAFYGLLLILAVHAAGRQFCRSAGLVAAGLVAACPLFHVVIRTGMGAFPNQLGLVLVPVLLAGAAGAWGRGRAGLTATTVAIAALAVTVPMMLLELSPLLALSLLNRHRALRSRALAVLLPILAVAAVAATACWIAPSRVSATSDMLTGHEDGGGVRTVERPSDGVAAAPASAAATPADAGRALGRAVLDFLAPKRVGFGAWPLDTALTVLFLAFGAWLASFRGKTRCGAVLAGWGMLTALQAGTGVLQFTLYQRAGWTLQLAAALLGGAVAAAVMDRGPRLRAVAIGGAAAAVLSGLAVVPRHRPHLSGAESELVRTVQDLDRLTARGKGSPAAGQAGRRFGRAAAAIAAATGDVVVVTRAFVGFDGGQGEPPDALLAVGSGLRARSLSPPAARRFRFRPAVSYVVLLDTADVPPARPWLAADPRVTVGFEARRDRLMKANAILRAKVQTLPDEGWRVVSFWPGDGLEGHWLAHGGSPP